MKFYSEYGEDQWIAENVKLPKDGFYLDVGAMRPDINSNTAFLRDMGWHGIIIDGHPGCMAHWKDVPNVRAMCAVVGPPGKVLFARDRELSRIINPKEPRQMAYPQDAMGVVEEDAETLSDILRHTTRNIDFISIDIEGAEFDALSTFPFDRFKPQVIVAEYAALIPGTAGAKFDFRVREMLVKMGYTDAHHTEANIVYLKQ